MRDEMVSEPHSWSNHLDGACLSYNDQLCVDKPDRDHMTRAVRCVLTIVLTSQKYNDHNTCGLRVISHNTWEIFCEYFPPFLIESIYLCSVFIISGGKFNSTMTYKQN